MSRADSRLHLPAVLDLVSSGKLRPLTIPTTVAPWDEADRAWLEPATKLVVSRSR